MNKSVIIVAGGIGSRMKSAVPKQFMLINGLPILMHTINCFHLYQHDISIRIVLPANQIEKWQLLCEKYSLKIRHNCIEGGATRYQSVKNGLNGIPENQLIAIHDGVRPLVSLSTITRCFDEAEKNGSAIPVIEVHETLRMVEKSFSKTVDRSVYKIVQTPQIFRGEILLKAYQTPFNEAFTDDASIVEACGYPVSLVEGNRENIKITTQTDLLIAEALIKNTDYSL
jgi:2-C-methyl-D-erythritol 4-phosphate cytidylyltransferase